MSRRRLLRRALGGAALCLALSATSAAVPVEAHETDKVGVLIVDHGEPVEFNEKTYDSFRMFLGHLIDIGTIPPFVLMSDAGTILMDRNCTGCPTPGASPELVDGWGRPFSGPATFVPATTHAPAHWLSAGGPGVGEPDFFEFAGHDTRLEWAAMGNHSPNYEQKLSKKLAAIDWLTHRYGDRIAVRVGYHINPHIGGSLSVAEAVRGLVKDEHVRHIVVGYHGVGFSDLMQTHMIRHEIHEELGRLGSHVPLTHAEPIGKSDRYVASVVAKVQSELAGIPADEPVAIHLSGHGMSLRMCGTYDCAADRYHEVSADLFARTKAAIEEQVTRPGRLGVFHLYGDGADPAGDPDNLVDSPAEALAKRKAAGFTYVVDIPYEFESDSRDTLIVLRQSYGLTPPDWNQWYETRFVRDGMTVKITNSSFGPGRKLAAFEEVVRRALDPVLAGTDPGEVPHHPGH